MQTREDMDTELREFFSEQKADNEKRKVGISDLAEIAEYERAIGKPDERLERQVDTERILANNVDRELKARGF